MQAADNDHVFVAIFSVAASAPGLSYLRVKIQQQLQAQIRLQKGAIAAVASSFAAIDSSYRRLHPFHGNVFEGVNLTLAYLDAGSQMVFLASSGACQAAACSLSDRRAVLVAGLPESSSAEAQPAMSEVKTIPLDQRLDGIVLGSAGLW